MSSDTFVPVLNIQASHCTGRYQRLLKYFFSEYSSYPDYFVTVPGRVNIIGEHVDYCGYPVLPMATEQSILLAVMKTNDSMLQLRNENNKYANFKTELNSFEIKMPTCSTSEWYSYFLCGVKGLLEYSGTNRVEKGMLVAVSSNIPPASGLSSSSALVCSAVLAIAFNLGIVLNAHTLATISAQSERYIGTQGGGMDQAIAFLAECGCAQLIEFYPVLRAERVKLPNSVYFVVANSLTEMNKASTSDFNQRVVECKIACRFLAKKMKLNDWKNITQFIVLQNKLNFNLEEMEKLAEQTFRNNVFSKDDILNEFDITKDEFETEFLTENTRTMEHFKLRQRTLHVFQESLRVQKFRDICNSSENDNIQALSELIKQSHNSLHFLYECSHPNLDELIRISNKIGVNARLTGAGWGGCIVALCDSMKKCEEYIEEIKEKYYKKLPNIEKYNLENVIFATSPQNGANIMCIYSN